MAQTSGLFKDEGQKSNSWWGSISYELMGPTRWAAMNFTLDLSIKDRFFWICMRLFTSIYYL